MSNFVKIKIGSYERVFNIDFIAQITYSCGYLTIQFKNKEVRIFSSDDFLSEEIETAYTTIINKLNL